MQNKAQQRMHVHALRLKSWAMIHEISGWLVSEQFRKLNAILAKYSPDQPRVPAGSPEGGQWTSGGGGGNEGDSTHQLSIGDTPQTGSPVNATTDGGEVISDESGNPIQMPYGVSIGNNIDFGKSIENLPSIMTSLEKNPTNGVIVPDIEMDPSSFSIEKELAMMHQFAPGQPMDYQRIYPAIDANGVARPNPTYVDFGNYNYGAVSAAAGYSLSEAKLAAAIVNARNVGNPAVDTSGPLFSNPRNNYFIVKGYNDYVLGKIKGSR